MNNDNFKVEFNGGGVLEILNKLTDDAYIKSKVLTTALKKGGEVLQASTVQVMKAKLGATATKNTTHKKPMSEGVRVIVDKNYYDVIVSILKDYRLKWFETGTDDRYRKVRCINSKGKSYIKRSEKGGYTGNVKGAHFFREARENTTGIDNAINASLTESLNKLFKA